MLWERHCENDVVRKTLLERRCEKYRNYHLLFKSTDIGGKECILHMLLALHLWCICFFSNADHAQSNNYWKSKGDRRPLASSFEIRSNVGLHMEQRREFIHIWVHMLVFLASFFVSGDRPEVPQTSPSSPPRTVSLDSNIFPCFFSTYHP